MIQIVLVIAFGALFLGGYFFFQYVDRKRREALIAMIQELGLELAWELPPEDQARFQRFEIAKRGRSAKSGTTVIADTGQTRMLIFDFDYVTGHGKHRRTHKFAISMCIDNRLHVPQLTLEPENWATRLSEFMGHKDMDFDDDSTFSSMFRLSGNDETEIRSFLTADRRSLLCAFPNQHMDATENILLLVRPRQQLRAESLRELMADSLRITQGLIVQENSR